MKLSKWIGVLTYSILFIFAILFYKERTIFIDSSLLNFAIIKDGTLAIQVQRFGAFFTQLSILITSQLGLALKIILLSYSVSFIIFYTGIYCIIKFLLGNDKLSLSLLLYNLLIVSGTFYWIQSEQIQGTAYLFLTFALLFVNPLKTKNYKLNIFLVFVLMITVVFMHPILVFQYLYMVLFLYFSDQKQSGLPKKSEILYIGVAFIVLFILKIAFFQNWYDRGAMRNVNNLITSFPNYLSLPSFSKFLQYLITDYYLLAVLLIVNSVLYVKRKEWFKLSILNCFFFGFLILVNVTYKEGPPKFYIESHYLTLSFFVIIPFVFDYLPTLKIKTSLVLVSLIILLRLLHIYLGHIPFTERLNWQRNYLVKTNTYPNKKIIISKEKVPMDTLYMHWATPYEFWLLSTLELKETRSIVIADDVNSFKAVEDEQQLFLTNLKNIEYDKLDPRYFILKDTSKYYIIK